MTNDELKAYLIGFDPDSETLEKWAGLLTVDIWEFSPPAVTNLPLTDEQRAWLKPSNQEEAE
jgi:hypothetical protein